MPQLALGGVLIVSGALATATLDRAWSQDQRTIKIVVPFTPGGGADALARLLADEIGRTRGATIVVENRPGAGTVIATEAVAHAEPDGNAVLLIANSFVINPALRKRNYDPLTSFDALCLLTRSPNAVVVNSSSPYRTLADLVNAARAKPGELTMAFQGPSTGQQIGYEKLKRAANIGMVPVTFRGAAPAANALLGDHVTSLFVNYPSVSELIAAGKLRALATASLKRSESLPDVPTVAELGYPNFEEDVWFGLVVPAHTSGQMVAQLSGWFGAAILAPEIKPRLEALGFTVVGTCGKDFASFLQVQRDAYAHIIREVGMKGE
jgi:tripartite-type tricarboxylate transporter receptor subunit TctC